VLTNRKKRATSQPATDESIETREAF